MGEGKKKYRILNEINESLSRKQSLFSPTVVKHSVLPLTVLVF